VIAKTSTAYLVCGGELFPKQPAEQLGKNADREELWKGATTLAQVFNA
jgi:hypothetical protein